MGMVESAGALESLCILWCIPGFLRKAAQIAKAGILDRAYRYYAILITVVLIAVQAVANLIADWGKEKVVHDLVEEVQQEYVD